MSGEETDLCHQNTVAVCPSNSKGLDTTNKAKLLKQCHTEETSSSAELGLLKNTILVDPLLEFIFVLDKLAHCFLMLHTLKQLGVHEGWAQCVDPHSIIALF